MVVMVTRAVRNGKARWSGSGVVVAAELVGVSAVLTFAMVVVVVVLVAKGAFCRGRCSRCCSGR